jgi:hypothetical protein
MDYRNGFIAGDNLPADIICLPKSQAVLKGRKKYF